MSVPFQNENQRVLVLIDAQNLYHSAKNLHQRFVNFKEVIDLAVGPRRLTRALAYVVASEENPKEADFFEALVNAGIQLRSKPLLIYPGGLKKADWDVGLTVDAIEMAPDVDVVVLASGDGDFLPLVISLQHTGKLVEAVAFGKTTNTKLREAVDYFYDLDQFTKKILLRK